MEKVKNFVVRLTPSVIVDSVGASARISFYRASRLIIFSDFVNLKLQLLTCFNNSINILQKNWASSDVKEDPLRVFSL
jgi:hypothetical protein